MSFDHIMLHTKAGASAKIGRLTPAERWAWFGGVMCLAGDANIRGTFTIGDGLPAEAQDVATRANVPLSLARSTLKKARDLGMLDADENGIEWVHDWEKHQPTPRNEDRTAARRQALFRDRPLKDAIRQRDGDRCRYCAIEVQWGDRRSPAGGTYDHLDPNGENSMENVVVACRGCNSAKGSRTPAQAGMVLLGTYSESNSRAEPIRSPSREVEGEVEVEVTDVGATSNVVSLPSGVAPSARGSDDGWGVAP